MSEPPFGFHTTRNAGSYPADLRKKLVESGINPDDPQVIRAMTIAVDYYLASAEDDLDALRHKAARLDEMQRRLRRVQPFVMAMGIFAGLASLVTTLVDGYPSFIDGLRTLLHRLHLSEIINVVISPAYAQAATQDPGTGSPLRQVIVYGIYLLFAIAYIVSMACSFTLEEPRKRANAVEVFKGLNAFFVGVVTGKVG